MEKFKTEGVVINAIPFRNFDCILTVFTPLEGLIKLFFRGAYNQKKGNGSGTTTPLSVVELILAKGKGELYTCVEITVVNHNLALRQNLKVLEAGCEMVQAISATQQPGKSAPELYQLLLMYLNKLPQVVTPQTITDSFRLKLLRYEGMLTLLTHCCDCSELLNDVWIHENEAFCLSHTPSKSLSFTKDERSQVELLAFSRDFSALANLKIAELLSQKICSLFNGSFEIKTLA